MATGSGLSNKKSYSRALRAKNKQIYPMKPSNTQIQSYITDRITAYEQQLAKIKDLIPLFKKLYQTWQAQDRTSLHNKLEAELRHNLINYWTNPEYDFDPTVSIDALYFEYDYYFHDAVDVGVYGIVDWKDFQIAAEPFDMKNAYDFAPGMYAHTGFTAHSFAPLALLDWPSVQARLPHSTENLNAYDYPGYQAIIGLYTTRLALLLHEAFHTLDTAGDFARLNYHSGNCPVMLGEHDMGEVQLVYVL